jgi:hypothetical protein
MSQIKKLTGAGFAPLQAVGVIGDEDNGTGAGITATGASQGTAYAIGAVNSHFTTVAASTGALLPVATAVGEELRVFNLGANSLAVYPPVGGKINVVATNGSVNVGAGTMSLFVAVRDATGAFNGLNYMSK